MIAAVVNSKGGVGKTTLAVHMAVWLSEQGKSLAFVDSDVQSSSSVWLKEASESMAQFRLQTPDDVLEQLPKIAADRDFVVVDGPAGLSEVTRAILLIADVAFLPCGPSILDLRAANEAIRVVKQAQKIRGGPPRAVLVPNKLQVQYRLSQEFIETVTKLDIPASSGLRLRQAFADAAGQGTVVWKMQTKSAQDAAAEMQILFTELFNDDAPTTSFDERSVANG